MIDISMNYREYLLSSETPTWTTSEVILISIIEGSTVRGTSRAIEPQERPASSERIPGKNIRKKIAKYIALTRRHERMILCMKVAFGKNAI